jgi:hypothetical protein
MSILKIQILITLICLSIMDLASAQEKNILSIDGTRFEMNGKPFEFTGVSFFNALYNQEFNISNETRRDWIRKFNETGINVLRIWCQWDNGRGFVDAGKDQTLYNPDGTIKTRPLDNLINLLKDTDTENTVVLMVFFSQESWRENIRLSDEASDKAVAELTRILKPYRNLVFQVWNEFDNRTLEYLRIIKNIDPARIVTNSPGYAGDLGSLEENRLLDYLSPHTTRDDNRHWEIAGKEIGYLLKKYNKPVVDDEPARKGTPKFGGPKNPVLPTDHILHIYNVWKEGGYFVYHHDMFQIGTDRGSVPLNGIPAPGFNEYHDQVFDFIKNKERYLELIR